MHNAALKFIKATALGLRQRYRALLPASALIPVRQKKIARACDSSPMAKAPVGPTMFPTSLP